MQIFAAPAALLAINTVDPQERLARTVLASLIEDFSIEPVYAGDAFLGSWRRT